MIYTNVKVNVSKVPVRFFIGANVGLKMQLTTMGIEMHTLEDFYKDANNPSKFNIISGENATKSLLKIALKYAVNSVSVVDLNIPAKYAYLMQEKNDFIIN